jgi:membrane protease YdiL (CAAX protease family)
VASLGSLWILKALSDLELHLLPKIGVETAYEVEHLNRGVKKATEENGLLAVAVFVVVPAFCEEIFFRGLVFRGIARSFSPAWAIAGTTVLFSFAHGTVVQRVMMIFAGLYFGTVVWLSGSLWAGIMAHAVNNLAVIAVTHFFGDQLDRLAAPAWLLALSLVVFVSALALLRLERPDERG